MEVEKQQDPTAEQSYEIGLFFGKKFENGKYTQFFHDKLLTLVVQTYREHYDEIQKSGKTRFVPRVWSQNQKKRGMPSPRIELGSARPQRGVLATILGGHVYQKQTNGYHNNKKTFWGRKYVCDSCF